MTNQDYREAYPSLLNKVVLNVDDNEMNHLVIAKILEHVGVKIVKAYNGQEAIKALKDGLRPDVILMDLEMPVLNGLATSQAIRKDLDPSIPIIINSGIIGGLERFRLSKLGITDFLEKPYSKDDIFSKISRRLQVAAH